MALTAGALTSSNITGSSVTAVSAVATGGTTPYSYQWYRSLTTGFTPGSTNLLSGATALTLNDSGLILGADYFYKVVTIDTAGSPATVTSSQMSVQLNQTPQLSPSQNVFAQSPFLGMQDLRFNGNTLSVQFDPAGSGTLVAGQAVKWSTTTSGGIPKVVPSTLAADVIVGFVNYDIKTAVYLPGDKMEVSAYGNVQYLQFVAAVNRGVFLFSSPSGVTLGGTGVVQAVTGGTNLICGYALDNVLAGALGRVWIMTPAQPAWIG